MKLTPLWTADAEDSFAEIIDHLVKEWGRTVALAFHEEVERTIELLTMFPGAGAKEVRDQDIRSIPVARQVRHFYRTDDKRLFVLIFIDVRGDLFQRVKVE